MQIEQNQHAAPMQQIDLLGLDNFEQGLLEVARHFLLSHENAESQAWHHAFLTAVEMWGETVGLAAAHHMSKYVKALLRFRADGLAFQAPHDRDASHLATDDEALMLAVLHYMRREKIRHARDAVAALTFGQMDPDVIRCGLSLAKRFSAGAAQAEGARRGPALRVVSS